MLARDQSERLMRVGPGTAMGALLRSYWQPVAAAAELAETPVKPIRLFGEDLVLYRASDGTHGLLSRSCPHRGADLSYGWVEGGGLRCTYHGWLFDKTGTCQEQPFEQAAVPASRFRARTPVRAYPARELAGLVWAYLGTGPVPRVPLYEPFTWNNGFIQIVFSQLPCNWFHCHENAVDPIHFEWLHMNWSTVQRGPGLAARAPRHVNIRIEEFEHGFIANRRTEIADTAARAGLHTSAQPQADGIVCLWPNALYTGNHFEWRVPVDDQTTLNITWWYSPRPKDMRGMDPPPPVYWYGPVTDERTGRLITTHPLNQDFAAWIGQGPMPDRTAERLGRSDAGITMLRRRYLREMDVVAAGGVPKGRAAAEAAEGPIPLPVSHKERYTDGIDRATFEAELAAKRRRLGAGAYYAFQAGQPPQVQRAYEVAMGLTVASPSAPATAGLMRIGAESAMESCIFCRIAQHEQEPENIVYEDEDVVVFPGLHQRPRNQGHVEVITRAHVPTVYELDDRTATRLMIVTREVAVAARAAFHAEGITLHQHNEPAGGAHADHFHMHVVPRHTDDQYWASVGIREHEFIEVPAAMLRDQADRLRRELRLPTLADLAAAGQGSVSGGA